MYELGDTLTPAWALRSGEKDPSTGGAGSFSLGAGGGGGLSLTGGETSARGMSVRGGRLYPSGYLGPGLGIFWSCRENSLMSCRISSETVVWKGLAEDFFLGVGGGLPVSASHLGGS